MRIDKTQAELATSGLGALAADRGATVPRTAFASALAAQKTGSVATDGAAAGKDADAAEKLPKGPKGETTRKVDGKPYLEVMSGPRNGMFVNVAESSPRYGEAFVLVRRKEHDLHVYGTGKDRRVVVVPHDGASTAAPTDGAKGETTRKVPGHAYEEVLSGPRNGLFINTSGNVRDGQAFALVERKDHELHIYGTGKDRRVIVSRHVGDAEHAGGDGDAAKGGATKPPATGGVTAPSGDAS